jgi:uncharacterized protein (DUF3084 family)
MPVVAIRRHDLFGIMQTCLGVAELEEQLREKEGEVAAKDEQVEALQKKVSQSTDELKEQEEKLQRLQTEQSELKVKTMLKRRPDLQSSHVSCSRLPSPSCGGRA